MLPGAFHNPGGILKSPCYLYPVEKSIKWLHRGYCALFALLPWSFEYSFGSWKMNLPEEPLTVILGLGLGWIALKNPERIRSAISGNLFLPMSLIWIAWLAVSAIRSSIPVVSWKYWVVEAGHWWVFALGLSVFPFFWRKTFLFFAVSMAGVVVYALAHHATYHFRADQSLLAPMPFFPDHTMYGAVIAMVVFLPARLERRSKYWKIYVFLLLIGLFFSFSQGAWMSVLLAGISGLVFFFRARWPLFVPLAFIAVLAGIFFREAAREKAQDFLSHDVSFRERLNRYACAFRMARDRPWTGFGPGTYQFQYMPYQHAEEMTRISITAQIAGRSPGTYGRGGGAHSEYLQALSESGWPGLVLFIALGVVAFRGLLHNYFQEKNNDYQLVILFFMLSLMTFFLHGLLNNILHDGRVAALVWGMMAVGNSAGAGQPAADS